MQSASGSYRNLAALADGALTEGGPLSFGDSKRKPSRNSIDSQDGRNGKSRFIFVSNHLPLKCTRAADDSSWDFAWDNDALIAQAQGGIDDDLEVLFVGCLPVEIEFQEQEMVALELFTAFNCFPVFLGAELKERYYKGFCKQQLWPMLHYWLPLSPNSTSRFDPDLWQAYVKANKMFSDKLVEVISMDEDFVWIHDYHLMVLPSLLRKRFHRLRCGLFLHSPFPSSEVWRTFPKREELLRSLLNVDLIGFHTFDYARHFLSCCSRMLGLEHVTSRGSIMIEYYGRDIGVKIMPTGVNPERFLSGFAWDDTIWRRGELLTQFAGQTVLIGVDDMDLFKGIELKLLAVERVLEHHPEWRGRLVLVQVTNAPRSNSKDIAELHDYALSIVERVNQKYSSGSYQPIVWIERPVSLYEKVALYSVADVAVVTATRDGMNLVPYEYIVSREGAPDVAADKKASMLVVSEFVGCSPSLSGAIRVNPWNIDSVADGIYAAIKSPQADRHLRHLKHWRYVSSHTAAFWVKSFVSDMTRLTKRHNTMKCYGLGLGLNTFRIVALEENFRKLDPISVTNTYSKASKRLLLLDYDGTLIDQSAIDSKPDEETLKVVQGLCADPNNFVFIISGRARNELSQWFDPKRQITRSSSQSSEQGAQEPAGYQVQPAGYQVQPAGPGTGETAIAQPPSPSHQQSAEHNPLERLGLAAEHGYFLRHQASQDWQVQGGGHADLGWKDMVIPILEVYTESTDGSYLDIKESALVWHYKDADPDFGRWQAKELLDHLEGMLSNEAVIVTVGQAIVEVKPQGASKGAAVDSILQHLAAQGNAPDFVLCIGDDRSDEDMFNAMEHVTFSPHLPAEVFACTVGQKPSKAPFYMNDTADVASLLARLSEMHRRPKLAPSGKGLQRV